MVDKLTQLHSTDLQDSIQPLRRGRAEPSRWTHEDDDQQATAEKNQSILS